VFKTMVKNPYCICVWNKVGKLHVCW